MNITYLTGTCGDTTYSPQASQRVQLTSGDVRFANDAHTHGGLFMRPSSLGGGRILRRTLSVRLSVCPSVRLSVRPSRYRCHR